VQQFVQLNIKFLREKPETYVHPVRTLQWRVGDCDDQTILTCAMLRSVRIPARARFAWWINREGRKRGHVWCEGLPEAGRPWVPLETVRAVPYGYDPLARIQSNNPRHVDTQIVGDSGPI
jgi:transglutaminase-like putative cysteine protease